MTGGGQTVNRSRYARGAVTFVLAAWMLSGCGSSDPKAEGPSTEGTLAVPFLSFAGDIEDVAVPSRLAGIEIGTSEACPWIEDRVLLVLSTPAHVDPSVPVLVAGEHRFAIGDSFESNPLIELDGGFTCDGEQWPKAVQLAAAPTPIGG